MQTIDIESDIVNHHLKEQHPNLHSKNLKCLIFGGLDGIITTFAIISSCFGAGMNIKSVLILGLANIIADGLSMGFGEFISADLERDYINSELKKEEYEYDNNLEEEKEELAKIISKKEDIEYNESKEIIELISKHKDLFLELMLKKELDLELPEDKGDIIKGSLVTFCSFLFFGLIPIVPYFIHFIIYTSQTISTSLFIISYFCSAFSVFILGLIYICKTKQSYFYLFKLVITATIAAVSAYFIGFFLESLL